MTVTWAEAVQSQRGLGGAQIITVAAQTDTLDGPIYLAVPVRRTAGALALAGYPASTS